MSKFSKLCIIGSLYLLPLSYKFSGLRISEVLLMLTVVSVFRMTQLDLARIVFFMFVILGHGVIFTFEYGFSNVKYGVGFLFLIWSFFVISLFTRTISDPEVLIRLLMNICLLLCGLVALSYLQWLFGWSSSPRPSFVGVADGFSDAHLLSNLTALLWSTVAFARIINKTISYRFFVFSFVVGTSLILNGSRNGIALYGVSVFLLLFHLPNTMRTLFLFLLVSILGSAVFSYVQTDSGLVASLIKRALFQGVFSGQDVSVGTRLDGLTGAFSNSVESLLFGRGVFSVSSGFYDGGVTLWIQLFGLFGLLLLFSSFSFVLFSRYVKGFRFSTYILLLILLSFGVSEFFITTRGALIYSLVFCSIYRIEQIGFINRRTI
jgi:hypothetical protein